MKGVVKSVKKKLNKIWSKNRKNKNKNKSHQIEHHYYYPPPQRPPPPPPLLPPPPFNRECRHCCYCSTQPSAPPLPESSSSLWLEAEHNSINYGTFLAQPQEQQEEAYHEGEAYHARQTQTEEEEIAMVDSETVYGVPVLPLLPQTETRRRDRSRGVYSIGAYLFQCLCPCLRIRESQANLLF
ncbi:hypothetical protein PIB30_011814 [Stylosanthes scabra]|uniref:Uncharacterized protein n=1 Tax=Stylosanthes scabra TaxID=79078 RepID=A0ABU6S7A7_9FABA|nr:hypothetical protein [Stylosanthes scabra]